jgi:hypothetical protein
MIWGFVKEAFGAILKPVTAIVDGWQQRKTAKLAGDLRIANAQVDAKIARLATGQKADIAWENLSITNSGWKDEWFTLLLSIPAIMSFIPAMWGVDFQGIVRAGFSALKECPDWYNWMLGIAVGSAFGYRRIADFMSRKKGD